MVHIFSFIIMTYLKKFIRIKLLNTKQWPAELSPWIIPRYIHHLTKNIPPSFNLAWCSHQVWTVLLLHPNLWGNPVDWVRICLTAKNCLFLTPGKFSLLNSNFHVITQYKFYLNLLIAVVSYFFKLQTLCTEISC